MGNRTLIIKICSVRSPQRYVMERTVLAALHFIRQKYSDVQEEISQVIELNDILKYTQVLLYPGLVINERLVCSTYFPKREEVARWLEEAITESDQLN